MVTVDVLEVVSCVELALRYDFMQEWTPFLGKLHCQREEENEQNRYSDSEKNSWCTQTQGSRPQANQQHVYFVSEVHGNIKYSYNNWSKMLFF